MHVHLNNLYKPETAKQFLINRCIRIYPIYWLIFLLVFLTALSAPSLRRTVPYDAQLFLKALSLMPLDSSVVGGTAAPVLIVAWSLQYELYFYLLFCFAILSRWLADTVIAVLVGGLILGIGGKAFPANFIWSEWTVLFWFGVGIEMLLRLKLIRIEKSVMVMCGSTAVFVALGTLEIFKDAGEIPGLKIYWGLDFAGLIFGCVRYEQAAKVLPWFMRQTIRPILG